MVRSRRLPASPALPAGVLLPAALVLLIAACGGPDGGGEAGREGASAPGDARAAADEGPVPHRPGDLELRPLAEGVWLHTTWQEFDGVLYLSQGLAVVDGDGILLVDSAWGDEETRELVARLEEETGLPVTGMVSTHHHEDRVSGVAFMREHGARVLAHPLTPALAEADGLAPPDPLPALAGVGSTVMVGPVELFYPGPGHAVDNLVAWVPSAGILYGGCAVRPGDTESLGNTADADVAEWPRSIERVRARYGDRARVVVPGHAEPGGVELLDHTIGLFAAGG